MDTESLGGIHGGSQRMEYGEGRVMRAECETHLESGNPSPLPQADLKETSTPSQIESSAGTHNRRANTSEDKTNVDPRPKRVNERRYAEYVTNARASECVRV